MPIEKPHIGRFGPYRVVGLHVVTPRAAIQAAMGAAHAKMEAAFKEGGITRTGPWFAHYGRMPTDTFEFDMYWPVAEEFRPDGEFVFAELPEVAVARTAYHGGYEGLPGAWGELVTWIKANGHATREDFFEVYSIGPGQEADAEAWQTDLIYPLVESAETALDKDRII